jgi:precorrin-6Y C5,15-methyltransferase (decarboxylating)
VLPDLPAPDALFAGGGDDGVLGDAVRTARPGRVVVTLASVDRVRSVCELLTGLGYRVAGSQVQAARLTGLPGGSVRLAAVNPVFVIWADSKAAAGGEKGGAVVAEGPGSEARP